MMHTATPRLLACERCSNLRSPGISVAGQAFCKDARWQLAALCKMQAAADSSDEVWQEDDPLVDPPACRAGAPGGPVPYPTFLGMCRAYLLDVGIIRPAPHITPLEIETMLAAHDVPYDAGKINDPEKTDVARFLNRCAAGPCMWRQQVPSAAKLGSEAPAVCRCRAALAVCKTASCLTLLQAGLCSPEPPEILPRRLLGLEPVAQACIFDFYQATLEHTLCIARKEGRYDDGITSITGTAVTLAREPEVQPSALFCCLLQYCSTSSSA